jgi:YD repeat-containing protein
VPALLSRVRHTYVNDRLALSERATNSGWRTEYEAGYTADRLDWEVDQTGVRTEYSDFDFENRPRTIVQKGFAGAGPDAPAQPDRTTTQVYNAEGQLVSSTVSDGTSSVVNTWTYDTAGNLKAESVNGVQTSYSQTNDPQTGGRIETKTLPGGLTHVTSYYLDGRPKSMTGTAVVPSAYSYGVQDASDPEYQGMLWKKTEAGVSTPGAAGAVWTKVIEDAAGRERLTETQRPGQSGTIRRERSYDGASRLVEERLNGQVVRTLSYNVANGAQTETRYLSATQTVVNTRTEKHQLVSGSWRRVVTSSAGSAETILTNLPVSGTYGEATAYTKYTSLGGRKLRDIQIVERKS